MPETLDWRYDDTSGSQIAAYPTPDSPIRIRAIVDQSPSNPFTDWDCNLPIVSYGGSRDGFTPYAKELDGDILLPLGRITDALMVHDQRAVAAALGFPSVAALIECHGNSDDAVTKAGTPRKYFRDADAIRQAAEQAYDDLSDSDRLDVCQKLWDIAGVPSFSTTSRGYSQGDWAELLVIAPPELVEKFGITDVQANLEATADLWSSWAWGDVYGWVVERIHADEDGEVDEELTEELDSCWGYYGSDHGDSGLEEAAIASADWHGAEIARKEGETADA